MPGMNDIAGNPSVLFLTFDSLRYDVAVQTFQAGLTPHLALWIPDGWEERHTPGTFTFAAHQAFFAGFLPTPARPGRHERLFAARFEGSETTTANTFVFDTPDIVSGFRACGYRTACIGGVGFFNKKTPLGQVLPSLFEESYWEPGFGVTDPHSAGNQFAFAARWLEQLAAGERFFLFINVSAIHQPNYFYEPGSTTDSLTTHAAALRYVDSQLPLLADALRARGDTFTILCADHGTAYGEEGYRGHRLSHPSVLTVPYAQVLLKKRA
jgi:hypothetical protein